MKTIELIEQADADKVLRLEIPVDDATRQYRLIVLIEPAGNDQGIPERDEWPAGFFERTAGQWVGDLIRAPQGKFETRESL